MSSEDVDAFMKELASYLQKMMTLSQKEVPLLLGLKIQDLM